MTKEQLTAELIESNRILAEDAKQIQALGEKVNRYEKALKDIVESEDQNIRSYGLGDIARQALAGL